MVVMKAVRFALIATGALASFSVAAAPADVITARQQGYKQIGRAFKAIGDSLKATPDVALIRTNAAVIAQQAPKITSWFPAGTGKEAGVKTGALPAIWSQRAEFDADAKKFADAAKAFNGVAAKGNVDEIKTAAGALGQTCKGCHTTFRERDS
ncbi:cytochrome c [Sphingomonas sp. AP4-R1]|uniref:c-type cytochrome n=1 Tax=Sphingomonas sp. AP4-R1 TaxID=2735134 RepID=UPI001493DB18|nr:cytochrome c [Sphingomonas sp. AP4-R1]QJU58960.1 cytochrome c [Sphingomonas sp. AP4-R1]